MKDVGGERVYFQCRPSDLDRAKPFEREVDR